MFDIDGDGIADDTSWIGATEAFLFLDRDGTVSGIAELSFRRKRPCHSVAAETIQIFQEHRSSPSCSEWRANKIKNIQKITV
jgi:hypothetical protein